MRVRAESSTPMRVKADLLAVPIYKDDLGLPGELGDLDKASGGVIRQAIDWGEFNPIEHPSALIDGGDLPSAHLLLVNAGSRGRQGWNARRIASVATRRMQGHGVERLALWLRDEEDADAFLAAGVGAMAGTYRPTDIYGRVRDTDAMRRNVEEVILLGAPAEAAERAETIGEGIAWGRDLANRAANDLYPEKMADVARELEADGCVVEVLDPDQMRDLGMGCLVGVGQGAAHGPRLVAVKLPGWATG